MTPTMRYPRSFKALGSFMSHDREIDGRTLPQFDEELGTLRSTEMQLERVVPVGRKRSTFAPINILPSELLGTTFTVAIDYESDTARSNNETLMLVCRYWNDLVNNTPPLWTKIRKGAVISNAHIIRALENSQDSPLEIEYGSGLGWFVAEDETAFLGTVFPHAHRWRKSNPVAQERRIGAYDQFINTPPRILFSLHLQRPTGTK